MTRPRTVALTLPGLHAPGTISVDRWGLPHIRAASPRDAFFLQGFNAARDRLWQIDLWRKRGLGLLAADFGPGYLAQDRASRLFLYRGDMAAEWAAYGPDARDICAAFAAGINAAVDAVAAGALPLPAAFSRFDTRPARWAPEDVVRIRIHSLAGNAISEFLRLRLMQVMGAEAGAIADQLRAPLVPEVAPEDWGPLPPVPLPDAALDVYRLAVAPVSFAPERLRATLAEAGDWAATRDGQVVRMARKFSGSNNWAVAGSHTATGRPLMASDPHRAYSAPSIRYGVHLEAPGLNVIGGGEPHSPGVMAGHNGFAAFSMTFFPADQEDLLVLADPPLIEVAETVPVRGAPDQPVTLRFAGKAPVLWRDGAHVLALRTTFTEPGTAPYMACLASMRARSGAAFRAALKGWGAPPSNQVYADMDGTVLWQVAARVPRRGSGRGLVPGGGDWTGFMADLPGIVDPACGFVHSANQMNLPGDWDHAAHPVGFEWFRDHRAARVAEVLAGAPTDVAGSCALQTDVLNTIALRLIACLPTEAADADADAAQAGAARALRGWDGHMTADSAEALIYATWTARHLYPALIARLPEPARKLIEEVEETAVVELFEGTRPRLAALLGLAGAGARAALLDETLFAALRRLRADHGEDRAGWSWGDAHRAHFQPAEGGAGVGPLAVGGGCATVMMTAYAPPSFLPSFGASLRMVVDVGAWDESRWINTPGQAGDAAARHGADLASLWAAGDYVPMPYSRAAVDAATAEVWELAPAG